jgi:hypothetical protein
MVYGLWFMVYGLWFMVYGLWFMVYGLWFRVYGNCKIVNNAVRSGAALTRVLVAVVPLRRGHRLVPHVVALQVEFERQTLKLVFSLDRL